MIKKYVIAIHGGAGTILRSNMTNEIEQKYKMALNESILAGENILLNSGLAIDAVEAAIRSLENNPLFNAGRGSVFSHEGEHEMDASIMNGKDLMAGAVAGQYLGRAGHLRHGNCHLPWTLQNGPQVLERTWEARRSPQLLNPRRLRRVCNPVGQCPWQLLAAEPRHGCTMPRICGAPFCGW